MEFLHLDIFLLWRNQLTCLPLERLLSAQLGGSGAFTLLRGPSVRARPQLHRLPEKLCAPPPPGRLLSANLLALILCAGAGRLPCTAPSRGLGPGVSGGSPVEATCRFQSIRSESTWSCFLPVVLSSVVGPAPVLLGVPAHRAPAGRGRCDVRGSERVRTLPHSRMLPLFSDFPAFALESALPPRRRLLVEDGLWKQDLGTRFAPCCCCCVVGGPLSSGGGGTRGVSVCAYRFLCTEGSPVLVTTSGHALLCPLCSPPSLASWWRGFGSTALAESLAPDQDAEKGGGGVSELLTHSTWGRRPTKRLILTYIVV